jgi:hypothetical protein
MSSIVPTALGDAETVTEAVDLERLDAIFGEEFVARVNPVGQPEPVADRAAGTGHDSSQGLGRARRLAAPSAGTTGVGVAGDAGHMFYFVSTS